MVSIRQRFKPFRRKNGGFGHSVAKYAKHPGIKNNLNLEGFKSTRSSKPIKNSASSLRELLKK